MKKLNNKTYLGLQAILALAILFVVADKASAQVYTIQITKDQSYEQTSTAAPTTPYSYGDYSYFYTDSASDADSFTVSDVDSYTLLPEPGDFTGGNSYTSLADLNAAFVAGDNYTITATGGTLDGESGTLAIPADAYAPLLYLPASSYTAAQHISPNADFTFDIASVTAPVGGTGPSDQILFILGNYVYAGPAVSSLTIPQADIDALTPGQPYFASLGNFGDPGSSESVMGDFSSSSVDDFFNTQDYIEFVVAPEPSLTSMLMLGLVVLAVACKVRARRTQA